ncbi:MAG: glyoxalase/bleomycin resistance protein/dioxygenase [Chloroflexi bacterium]|nr:glyoxalase/bleomycin resistance protein/dioxygenase [Chloroflexota bacterium]
MSPNAQAEPSPVYPTLSYRDASAAIAWLNLAFGFTTLMEVPGPEGTIAHAELSVGSGVIMLGTAKREQGWLSPLDLAGVNQSMYVFVADPNAHYARAKAAGAEIVREPIDTDYGSREYGARDLEGHYWFFGTYRPGA